MHRRSSPNVRETHCGGGHLASSTEQRGSVSNGAVAAAKSDDVKVASRNSSVTRARRRGLPALSFVCSPSRRLPSSVAFACIDRRRRSVSGADVDRLRGSRAPHRSSRGRRHPASFAASAQGDVSVHGAAQRTAALAEHFRAPPCGAFLYGETQTRTGDTTIFSHPCPSHESGYMCAENQMVRCGFMARSMVQAASCR
jgi:hypothetical protein